MLPRAFPIAAVLTAAALPAQPKPELLLLTQSVPLLLRVDSTLCTVAPCPVSLPPAPNLWAGGVAHDPRDRFTWLSDGTMIGKIDVRAGCVPMCTPFPAPNLAAGHVVTGLAFSETTQSLFVSHSDNRILTFSAIGCTLVLQSQCVVTVPTNHIVSALATDEATGFLLYASSPWTGPGPAAEIKAVLQASPCTLVCGPFNPVAWCDGTAVTHVTGIAFDECDTGGTLHITDSQQTLSVAIIHPCGWMPVGCCAGPLVPPGERAIGMSLLPPLEVSSHVTCFAGTMTSCLAMQHVLRGDPTLGNWGFALDLVNAPSNVIAVLLADVGPCNPTLSLGLCDLMPTIPLKFANTLGSGGCTGAASHAFPLPAALPLCHLTISTRWCGFIGNVSNNFVSNCLTWTISGS